jgi:hypothetical protein
MQGAHETFANALNAATGAAGARFLGSLVPVTAAAIDFD